MESALEDEMSSSYSESHASGVVFSPSFKDICTHFDSTVTPTMDALSAQLTFRSPSSANSTVPIETVCPTFASPDQSRPTIQALAGGDQGSDKTENKKDDSAHRTTETHPLSLDIRHAKRRLQKYRMKVEQLRQSTESRLRMMGALHVRRNTVISDVVCMARLAMTSRQNLDEQRRANKELMKHIEQLTVQDTANSFNDVVGNEKVSTSIASITPTATASAASGGGGDGTTTHHSEDNCKSCDDNNNSRKSSSGCCNRSNNSSVANDCSNAVYSFTHWNEISNYNNSIYTSNKNSCGRNGGNNTKIAFSTCSVGCHFRTVGPIRISGN